MMLVANGKCTMSREESTKRHMQWLSQVVQTCHMEDFISGIVAGRHVHD